MKINMAEGDYFNIGMIVSCTTCHGQKVQGEVIAFDYGTKMLALKSPSSSGKPNTNDVRLLNLSMVGNIVIIEEAKEVAPPLTNLNMQKISNRMRQNLDNKMRKVNYIGVGVTPEAQSLFHAITKTISDVNWDGQNIVVMDQVIIVPPYGTDNCSSRGKDSKALSHVKKVVDKYYKDAEKSKEHSDTDREESPSSTSS